MERISSLFFEASGTDQYIDSRHVFLLQGQAGNVIVISSTGGGGLSSHLCPCTLGHKKDRL